MTNLELRQKIEQQLDKLPPEQLLQVSNFLDSLEENNTIEESPRPLRRLAPIKRGNKAEDLLKFAGTWEGDDLEECLKNVFSLYVRHALKPSFELSCIF